MRKCTCIAIVAAIWLSSSALASTMDMEYIVATEDDVVFFGDLFNDGVLDPVQWYVASGSPGPEAGEVLTLSVGDAIFSPLSTDPNATVRLQAAFTTEDWTSNTVALITFIDEFGAAVGVAVANGYFFAYDSTTFLLGDPEVFPTDETVVDFSYTNGTGAFTANVNGFDIFDGSIRFGKVSGILVALLPEPASLMLLGCATLLVRRRA
jgi:hypothetical protein